MATSIEYIEFVCGQIKEIGEIRYRKMFGEYTVYINDKPIILVCDNTPFVKKLDVIEDKMKSAEVGIPYEGAKEQYILDVEDQPLVKDVLTILEQVTPLPKPKKKAKSKEQLHK